METTALLGSRKSQEDCIVYPGLKLSGQIHNTGSTTTNITNPPWLYLTQAYF